MDLLLGYANPDYTGLKTQDAFLLGPDGDIQFDNLGKIRTVENETKLVQLVGKILLTEQGENIFEERYGTILQAFIGQSVILDTTYALIKQTILDAMGLFISLQQDINNTRERIATIESLGVTYNENNLNTVNLYLSVTTEAAKEVTTTISIPYTG